MTCTCGRLFRCLAIIRGRKVWYWCPECDAHGSGCTNRNHATFIPGSGKRWDPCTY